MSANRTITAVNTKLTLIASNPWVNNTASDALGLDSTISGLVSPLVGVPLTLEGMVDDNIFSVSPQVMADTQVGMDGTLYGGRLASAKVIEFTVTFIAASGTLATLQSLAQLMDIQNEVMQFSGTMIIPSQGKTFTLNNGYWLDYQSIPTHGRLLQPVPCKFRFESATQTAGG